MEVAEETLMGQEPYGGESRREAEAVERARPPPDEHRIRQRAHEIWVEEGRPDGRALDHWMQARWELENAPDPKAELELLEHDFKPVPKTG
jgi:DUF2934 family protein